MATYFHGNSEIQAAAADGMQLQTLYLMNPNYVPYSDTATLPNNSTLLLNPAGNALNPSNISHAPPSNAHHHLLVGTPLPAPFSNLAQTSSEDINRSSLHGIFPPAAAVHYDLWGSIDQNSDQDHSQVVTLAAHTNGSPLGLRRPVASSCRQGLSLSLSSKQAGYSSSSNNNRAMDIEGEGQARGQVAATSPVALTRLSENSPSSVSAVSNGIPNVQSVLWGSKYLRTAQELLDEVINVGNMITDSTESKGKMKLNKETMATAGEGSNTSKLAAELTTAQRQELQIKKAKLVSMLDEVEQRYRQYHHQMQLVISSFEQAAGFGSAKSYTALALRTISKQFRCLKDAICGEIKATSKKLGEEECLGAKIEGSRLRSVDNQLRQQRSLQQLGMMQHNAWRPQRGLPERAVSILRAWLFEHFLHPYPKDSDKHILAKQTGLTRSQVSNWFINARVRLWKPMVEEMYLQEMKEQERNGSEDNVSKIEHKESGSNSTFQESISFKLEQEKAFQCKAEKSTNHNASPTKLANSAISISSMGGNLQAQTEFNLIGSSFLEGIVQRSPKKPRSTMDMQNSPSSILSIDMDHMKQGETSRELIGQFGSERLTKDGYNLVTSTTNHGGGGFGAYTMGDIGRFNPDHLAPRFHGNGVSLTLGLPHGENLSISGPQQNLLSGQNIQLGRGLGLGSGEPGFCGIDSPQPSHSSTGYEHTIDIQSRKRFAAQLLPDFVT